MSWEADVQWWEAPVNPEQIESAEFFVGMRGYERAEVRAFLAATAAEHRALLERVAELESRPAAPEPPPQVDPAEELGQHVAAILRTARESARALLADAERDAAVTRSTAEADAEATRREAEGRRAEADRILVDARASVTRMTDETMEKARQESAALVAEGSRRHAESMAAADEMVSRLKDAVTGVNMALLALRPDIDLSALEQADDDTSDVDAPS